MHQFIETYERGTHNHCGRLNLGAACTSSYERYTQSLWQIEPGGCMHQFLREVHTITVAD